MRLKKQEKDCLHSSWLIKYALFAWSNLSLDFFHARLMTFRLTIRSILKMSCQLRRGHFVSNVLFMLSHSGINTPSTLTDVAEAIGCQYTIDLEVLRSPTGPLRSMAHFFFSCRMKGESEGSFMSPHSPFWVVTWVINRTSDSRGVKRFVGQANSCAVFFYL